MATHLYYMLQEALHNVVKHARANCVGVSFARHHGRTALLIEVDGQGFDPSARPADSKTLGLISMGSVLHWPGASLRWSRRLGAAPPFLFDGPRGC